MKILNTLGSRFRTNAATRPAPAVTPQKPHSTGPTKVRVTKDGFDSGGSTSRLSSSGGQTTLTTTRQEGSDTRTTSASTGAGQVTVKHSNAGEDGGGTTGSVTVSQPGSVTGTVTETGSNGVGGSLSVGMQEGGGEVSVGVSAGGWGVSLKVGRTSIEKDSVHKEDGYTTATTTTTVAVTVDAGLSVPTGRFGAGQTHTEQVTYQVRMSDADYARVAAGEQSPPDPYEPLETMPVGSSVLMRGGDYEQTRFSAAWRDLVSTTASVTEGTETSVLVERVDEQTVRVTRGPTDVLENTFNVGLGVGPVSVGAGVSRSRTSSYQETVEFDLGTPEGKAAYEQFLVDGTWPEKNAPGTRNAAQIEVYQGEDALSVNGALGPYAGQTEVAANDATVTVVTHADGSKTVTTSSTYEGNSMEVTQHFGADGEEDVDRFQATVTFPDLSGGQRANVVYATTGDRKAAYEAGQQEGPLVITLNHAQVTGMMTDAQDTDPSSRPFVVDRIANAASPYWAVSALIGGAVVNVDGGSSTTSSAKDTVGDGLLFIARGGDPQAEPVPLDMEVES